MKFLEKLGIKKHETKKVLVREIGRGTHFKTIPINEVVPPARGLWTSTPPSTKPR